MNQMARAFDRDTTGQVHTGSGNYRGFAYKNTHAIDPATIEIFDGTADTGVLLDIIQLVALGSDRAFYPDGGLFFATGLYVKITGTANGSVRIE